MTKQEFRMRLAGLIRQRGQIPCIVPTFGNVVDEMDLATEIDLLVGTFTGMSKAEYRGTVGITFRDETDARATDPEQIMPAVQRLSARRVGPVTLVAYDLASIHNNLSPAVAVLLMRQLRDWNEEMKSCDDRRKVVQIIIVDREEPKLPIGHIPMQLPVPDRGELCKLITDIASVADALPPFDLNRVANALTGLPACIVSDALAASKSNTGKFSPEFLVNERGQHLRKAGLELMDTTGWNIDSIGGNENVKAWITDAKVRFTDRELAEQYGLKTLRGLLLAGVQGTGKTALAKLIAAEFGVPLVLFTSVMDKYLGDSEKKLRTQLDALDAVGDIVVLIDEISDMFGGSGGDSDGGASGRVRSALLTWMSEHKSNVFVIGTTNDPDKLPPQMIRDGRIDECFSVLVPTRTELTSIVEVMKRRYPMASDVDTSAVVAASLGLVGAEVEGVFVKALEKALKNRSRVSTEMVVERCKTKSRKAGSYDPTGAIKTWMAEYCTPASVPDAPDSFAPMGVKPRQFDL